MTRENIPIAVDKVHGDEFPSALRLIEFSHVGLNTQASNCYSVYAQLLKTGPFNKPKNIPSKMGGLFSF